MNQYPVWKYLLVLVVILAGILYALPNLYGKDPSIQISAVRDTAVSQALADDIAGALQRRGLDAQQIELTGDGKVLARFADTDTQGQALDVVRGVLNGDYQSLYAASLNLAPATPAWLRAINGKPMVLGLDLQGGVHFLIEIDMETARRRALANYEQSIGDALREERIRYSNISLQGSIIDVALEKPEQLSQASGEIARVAPELEQASRNGDQVLRLTIPDRHWNQIANTALQQNLTVLRNRVNVIGVAEPVVQQQGSDRIVVELPGIQDTEEAKIILEGAATLEYRGNCASDPFAAEQAGVAPAGCKLYKERGTGSPVLLSRQIIVSGDQLTNATPGFDQQTGQPIVSVRLNSLGARRMLRHTQDHVGDLMGVVFIESLPGGQVIEEVISNARINGVFGAAFQTTGLSNDEAQTLAKLLGAGSLAAPIQIVEERTIGPSLGKLNIEQGFKSVAIGFALVLLFMVVYYRLFGLVANLALLANLVLVVALLSIMGATLTLPGIAGMVLTIGMAVDANVLIFERVREELRLGNTPQASIKAGYEKALSTIADANVTTLIAAVVLFTFGTGPIKGFAVVLSLGILTSMFTAIVGTRAVVNLIYGRKARVAKL